MYKVWKKARNPETLELVGMVLVYQSDNRLKAEAFAEGKLPAMPPAPVPFGSPVVRIVDPWPADSLISIEVETPDHTKARYIIERDISAEAALREIRAERDKLRARLGAISKAIADN